MVQYLARIIRALTVSFLGFGGGIALLVFIVALVIYGDAHAFQKALIAGIGLGLVFAVLFLGILLPLDLTAHLFLVKGTYKGIWDLEQTREVLVEGTNKNITHACRQALLAIPLVKYVNEDPDQHIIHAEIGSSWRSSGEIMEVNISQQDNKWKIFCVSRPNSNKIVFDYGKNFENVETWLLKMSTVINRQKKTSAT